MSVRVFSALSLLTIVGTIGAAQFDFVRRHYPGITPQRYWLPQVMQVWLPGLGVALALGVVAFVLERRARGQ